MSSKQHEKRLEKDRNLRKTLWPSIQDSALWIKRKGFAPVPRTMALIMVIMDHLSPTKKVSLTYLELWCRANGAGFVHLRNQEDLAFHSGFIKKQRQLSSWRGRLDILQELKFIDIQPGSRGEKSYALIWNPYHVIEQSHKDSIPLALYNALKDRAREIGADDFEPAENITPEPIHEKHEEIFNPFD